MDTNFGSKIILQTWGYFELLNMFFSAKKFLDLAGYNTEKE